MVNNMKLSWNQLKEQIEALPEEKRNEFVKIWVDRPVNDFHGVANVVYDEKCGVGPYISIDKSNG